MKAVTVAKALTVISMVLTIASCGWLDRQIGVFTGYSKMCVDGVSYLQFTSGASVQYDISGKPVACK